MIILNHRLNEIQLSHQKRSQTHSEIKEKFNKITNDYENLKPTLQAVRRLDQHIASLRKRASKHDPNP